MSILAKVSDNMFSFAKGSFTKDNPWFVPRDFNLFTVMGKKIFPGEILFHTIHELSAEFKTQLSNRVKIFALLADMFHSAPDGIAQGRNYTMNMGMQAQVLSPGMKYADSSALNRVMAVTKRA